MSTKKKLNRKQIAVIDDLFSGELDEQMVLERHRVSRSRYGRWLTDEAFGAELSRRIAAAYLQSQALIAKYSLVAAAKLVQLTSSDKEETARRACLDIISLPGLSAKKAEVGEKSQDAAETASQQFSQETASKLLEVLAEGEKQRTRGG